MIQKVGFWGSICSIISVMAIIFPQSSVGENQASYGPNSPNINSTGDVNINYNSSKESKTYNYIQHPSGGGTILIASPSLNNPQVVCHPEAGSKVQFISEQAESAFMVWVEVKILTGTCQGESGWIGKDNYHTHNG
jgi:hypothetical protein